MILAVLPPLDKLGSLEPIEDACERGDEEVGRSLPLDTDGNNLFALQQNKAGILGRYIGWLQRGG